jgi:hypothetical protein
MLKRVAHRECSDAKEEHNDRTYPKEAPLPNVDKSWRKQSESF